MLNHEKLGCSKKKTRARGVHHFYKGKFETQNEGGNESDPVGKKIDRKAAM